MKNWDATTDNILPLSERFSVLVRTFGVWQQLNFEKILSLVFLAPTKMANTLMLTSFDLRLHLR